MSDDARPDEGLLQQLLTTPPPEFVAERNRIAKQLRADGQRELAKAIAGLRRPSVADWALNVVASEHPDDVSEFVDTATAVGAAQTAAIQGDPGDAGVDVRTLLVELREATVRLVHLAQEAAGRADRTAAGSSVGVLTARLSEIAGNDVARELLRAGILGAEDPGVTDPFGIGSPSAPADRPARQRQRRGSAKSSTQRDTVSEEAPETARAATARAEADAEERRARMRAVAAAERAHAKAEKRLQSADVQLQRLETTVAALLANVEDAQAKLDEAKAKHQTALDALGDAQQRRGSVATEIDDAAATLDAARRALDDQ